MLKKIKLKEIANIQAGLLLSRKEVSPEKAAYKYKILKLKNLPLVQNINTEELDDFFTNETIAPRYLIKPDDIIVKMSNPAYFSMLESNINIVIPSHFSTITVHDKNYLPEYVYFCLNQNSIKNKLGLYAEGSQILRAIKTSQIENLEIPVKNIEEQKKIINISKLFKKKDFLLKELIEKENLLNSLISEKIIGE